MHVKAREEAKECHDMLILGHSKLGLVRPRRKANTVILFYCPPAGKRTCLDFFISMLHEDYLAEILDSHV